MNLKKAKTAKLTEIAKMRSCWPGGTSDIIGAREPRKKDYGSNEPVRPMRTRILDVIKRQFANKDARDEAIAVASVCVVLAVALFAFIVSVPGAIEEAQDYSRQVVAEIRGVER